MAIHESKAFNVRKATLEDTKAIAELGVHVYTLTFGHSVEPEELQAFLEDSYSFEATATDIDNPNKDMIVATDPKDQIVGFALLTRGSVEPCIKHIANTVELQRIYIHPSAQGSGVGRLLASRLEDMAREQGFEHMWLGVWEENHRGITVYEKLGFKKVGNHDFKVGGVVQTDFVMIKSL